MILKDKVAIIHAASGAIGSAVARAFESEGARLFLTGRSPEKIRALADELQADDQVVDLLDMQAIEAHAAHVVATAGRIDIVINAMSCDPVQGVAVHELASEDFMKPLNQWLLSQYLTAASAARQMSAQGAGAILILSASPARLAIAGTAGFGVACAALEGLTRTMAAELGPQGIRVAGLRVQRIWETIGPEADLPMSKPDFKRFLEDMTLTKSLPTLTHVAEGAVFLASDRGGATAGSMLDLTCGMNVG